MTLADLITKYPETRSFLMGTVDQYFAEIEPGLSLLDLKHELDEDEFLEVMTFPGVEKDPLAVLEFVAQL